MVRRYLVRYVILLLILIMCAGAALYFTETSPKSHEDAVLAFYAEPRMREAEVFGDMAKRPEEAAEDMIETREMIVRADGKEAEAPWAVQYYI